MSRETALYFQIHYHQCARCGLHYECRCEAPESVTEYVCLDCLEEDA